MESDMTEIREIGMIEKYTCADCGIKTDCISKEMKSTTYGVIFENLELCTPCADKRYAKAVDDYYVNKPV
jgi:hypothetical protein